MKTLYLIGGTMGSGKTTVSKTIKEELPNSVFLDGDWCWDPKGENVSNDAKIMVIENICFLLNQYLKSDIYQNIVFCWVMHESLLSIQFWKRLIQMIVKL